MRKRIIAGNWKANLTIDEAHALARHVLNACETEAVEVIICPPFTALAAVAQLLKGSRIRLGAQDVFWEPWGAFTGEVTPPMLADVGCRYVIIGHSERRTHFGETDQSVGRKLLATRTHALLPIVCIGETLAEREGKQTCDVLARQLGGALKELSTDDAKRLILAYEPVWAIGTGRNATPEQAQEAHAFIREWLAKRYRVEVAESIRIQYGGSVNASNAAPLLSQPDVDGALVGGASLKADAFAAIVKAAVDAPSHAAVRSKR
jgi:triosephosphate isomerase